MPAATNSSDLIAKTNQEYTKLRALIDDMSAEQALRLRDDNTAIKDIIGHRAHWIDLFLGWFADGETGRPVFFPAEGYKWNDLKAYNAKLRHDQRRMTWDKARALLGANHNKLLRFLDSHSEDDLYGGPMKGANNSWPAGRWAEAAGPSHYRSAAKWIRACLRADE